MRCSPSIVPADRLDRDIYLLGAWGLWRACRLRLARDGRKAGHRTPPPIGFDVQLAPPLRSAGK